MCKLEAVYSKKLILAYYKIACLLVSFDSHRSLSLEIVNPIFIPFSSVFIAVVVF